MNRRRGRQVLGALAGVVWGLGAAVLVQQFGLWPLDAALGYGAPLFAAILSGWWARRGSRRAPRVAAALMIAVTPLAPFALQPAGCEIFVDEEPLGRTTVSSPLEIDPENQPTIDVRLEGIDGRGTLWVEVAGVQLDIVSGSVGVLSTRIDLVDNGFYEVGRMPGIFHVGGDAESGCSVDGYVRVLGNPLANPIGASAAGAVVIGLAGTLLAGRRPRMPVARSGGSLRRDGRPIQAGRAVLQTPGLDGTVEIHEPNSRAATEALGRTPEATAAFESHGLETRHVLEVTNSAEWPHPGLDAAQTTPLGEPAILVQLPDPGPGFAQVVLATDEGGVTTWNYARTAEGSIDATPGAAVRGYPIARRVASSAEPSVARTAFASIGSKVISTVVFPLLDPVFGQIGELFARRWEAHHRPYGLRTITPSNFDAANSDEPDWDAMAQGKSLLLVHGTFSTTQGAFGALSPHFVADLADAYDGRIFAFDHPTLADDPKRNVEWLLAHIPRDATLDVDIVCHSRGGLVSRVLAERQSEIEGRSTINVDKVVFAGSPNAGTILAEPSYVGHLIDAYTNLVNFFPGPFVTDMLGAVITAVKQVAAGAVSGLEGLQAMRPNGPFLRWLNAPANTQPRYYAIAGDYEPSARGLRQYAANRLMDRVFREPNDLVVPFEGTFAANGSSLFPIAERHEFIGPDGVPHSGYFANKEVRDQLLDWLRS